MEEMNKNMEFVYPEKPKFPEQETGHVYFEQEADKSTEPFAKNVTVKAHTEYTSIKNDKGGKKGIVAALIDKSITKIKNDNVTSIGARAFSECSALTAANFPNATSIGNGAFSGSALTTVDFPNATSIGENAFYECSALTTVDLPNVTSIGGSAFGGISPNAVINIGAAEGEISGAPWGAPEGVTINYNVRS